MRYFRNASWMFGEQILRMIAGVLVGIWVARYLGPEQFGIFSYAISFVALFGSVAKLGLDSIVVRDLVNTPDKRDRYLGTAFWLKIAGAVLSLGLVAFATQFTNNDTTTNLYIFIIASGIVFQAFEVVDFYFQSKVLSKFVSLCKITQLFLSSIIKVYFVLTNADLLWFVLVSVFDQITLALTLYLAYRYQKIGQFFCHFDQLTAKKLIKNSWPIILSGIVVMIYMRIDQIMIKEILGAKEVGVYSAAVRLSEVWYFIPVLICNSLFPAIVNAKKVSEELYYARLQHLYTFMIWMAIAIALPITFLSDWLVVFLYGPAYREAGGVLAIQVWAGIFVFLGVASGKWFISENLQMLSFWRVLSGVFVNVFLNIFLIPSYGIEGAAMATLLSQVMAAYLFDIFNKKTRGLFICKSKAILILNYKGWV